MPGMTNENREGPEEPDRGGLVDPRTIYPGPAELDPDVTAPPATGGHEPTDGAETDPAAKGGEVGNGLPHPGLIDPMKHTPGPLDDPVPPSDVL